MNYKQMYKEALERAKDGKPIDEIFPELKESEDERIRKEIIESIKGNMSVIHKDKCIAWLKKQGEQVTTLPKWRYKKDNTPLLRDSLILNKYGCVAKSPSDALVSDVWVIDYAELAKLPKEEFEKQGEQESFDKCKGCNNVKGCVTCVNGDQWAHISEPAEWSEEDEMQLDAAIHLVDSTGHIATTNWLKSIKERALPHPKQEWSEEDTERINRIAEFIWANRKGDTDQIYQQEQDVAWLKSLSPQPKQEVINKVIGWLQNNVNNYIINDRNTLSNGQLSRDWYKVKSDCFDDLRKAMEE